MYARLTLHRGAIKFVGYLPHAKTFISTCKNNLFKIWRCNRKTKKQLLLAEFKIQKTVQDILLLPIKSPNVVKERFLVIFTTGESELFEFDIAADKLYWLETEKDCEHDCRVTGFDFNVQRQLMVTCDEKGAIRVWNRDKRFLREISFPTKIDSVSFLNTRGDLLVAHAQRISVVHFQTYWTKTFDYFGLTQSSQDPELAPIAKEHEEHFYDPDFVTPFLPLKGQVVETEEKMNEILSENKNNTEAIDPLLQPWKPKPEVKKNTIASAVEQVINFKKL